MEHFWENIEDVLVHKKRIIAEINGAETGPAIAFCAGLHGNEPTGVLALQNIFDRIKKEQIPVNGRLLAFIGNRNALHHQERFVTEDLNRMWTIENIRKLHQSGFSPQELHPEALEMIEIDQLLQNFIQDLNGEDRFFVDLHTTSSPSIPFAAIDNQPQSYTFALQLPIPFVANLDEFLKGTLMHYLDHIKFKAIVFEAGMHHDPASIHKHEAMIWLVLGLSGAINIEKIPNYAGCFTLLQGLSEHPHKVFKILYRYHVKNNETFEMIPGFINFQPIEKGTLLAFENGKPITAQFSGNIFMPLYQKQGADGYFIILRIENH